MHALYIIGTAFGAGVLGFVVGWMIGDAEGGDFNFAPAMYAPIGGCMGGSIGLVIGAVIWT